MRQTKHRWRGWKWQPGSRDRRDDDIEWDAVDSVRVVGWSQMIGKKTRKLSWFEDFPNCCYTCVITIIFFFLLLLLSWICKFWKLHIHIVGDVPQCFFFQVDLKFKSVCKEMLRLKEQTVIRVLRRAVEGINTSDGGTSWCHGAIDSSVDHFLIALPYYCDPSPDWPPRPPACRVIPASWSIWICPALQLIGAI